MFRFVTKKEYWDIEDSGLLRDIVSHPRWHLKSIQDAIAYSILHNLRGKKIVEIGGGNPRILPALAQSNVCFNIDKFKGVGHGPTNDFPPSVIHIINAYLGETKDYIHDYMFDVSFSISVMEHVPFQALQSFLRDNRRILKSGGLAVHLIDIYCNEHQDIDNIRRFSVIRKEFFSYFTPLSDDVITENDLHFSSSYATNPDNEMNAWNKSVPGLREKREVCQSCALLLAGLAK
jgi:SAM-dependent methyltransferase